MKQFLSLVSSLVLVQGAVAFAPRATFTVTNLGVFDFIVRFDATLWESFLHGFFYVYGGGRCWTMTWMDDLTKSSLCFSLL